MFETHLGYIVKHFETEFGFLLRPQGCLLLHFNYFFKKKQLKLIDTFYI